MLQIKEIPAGAPQMEFEFLIGDVDWKEYGGKWISPQLNNGDFDYWLVIEFINWLDATGELVDDNEFVVEITAVSIEEAGLEKLADAFSCMGFDDSFLDSYDEVEDSVAVDRLRVEALSSYGISAHLWSESGNDADGLLKKARQSAMVISGLFGFFMDSPQNAIGSTGWDLIAGNLLAGLERV